ncbi:MAG TPA: biotin transporter BioY [Candidatus Hydrogenedentes bacterium]|nr:biotin transporter BioY [Candidatus Hydrogenedentota bacterium]
MGFLVAPAVARLFPRESRWVPVSMAAMLAVVYLMGVSWMAYWLGFSLYAALMLGVVPFLPADALKLAAASVLVILWDRCRKSLSGARAEEK